MAVGYSRYLSRIYTLGDLVFLNSAFAAVSFVKSGYRFDVNESFLTQFLFINFSYLIVILIFRTNEISRVTRFERVFTNLFNTIILHLLLLITLSYIFSKYFLVISDFSLKYGIFVVFLLSWRGGTLLMLRFLRRRGLNYRSVIIVGGGMQAKDIYDFFIRHSDVGYRLQGIFQNANYEKFNNSEVHHGNLSEVKDFIIKNKTDEIYCTLSEIGTHQVNELMQFAERNLVRFKMIPDFRGFFNRRVFIDFYDSVPVLSLRNEPLQRFINRFIKRLFDLIFSLLVICLIFPWLFLAIAILIKLGSPGPVFFKQKRSGLKNKEFSIWKFRTMRVNNVADELQATKDDKRITPIGAFLRKTSLDEIPQFINVFTGDMSVVGPRPHMLKHTEDYSKMIEKFMVRHLIKPGITGWAQVKGFRGETKDATLMQKRVEHDVWYIENWSLVLDARIIMMTVVNLFKGEDNAA